jgi:hypothetical protein
VQHGLGNSQIILNLEGFGEQSGLLAAASFWHSTAGTTHLAPVSELPGSLGVLTFQVVTRVHAYIAQTRSALDAGCAAQESSETFSEEVVMHAGSGSPNKFDTSDSLHELWR